MDTIMVTTPHGNVKNTLDFADIATGTTTNGCLIKAGTSSATINCGTTTGMKFFSFYTESEATSDDARSIYNRLYISGIGGSGESLRCFTTVNNVAGTTAHGAHLSLNFGATGSLTGLGVAGRNTIHVPNAMSNGTFAAIQAEIYGEGASSSVSGTAEFSFIRAVVDGATAHVKATVDTSGYLMSIQGLTAASGKLFQVNTAADATHALRIKIGSTDYFILLTDTGA